MIKQILRVLVAIIVLCACKPASSDSGPFLTLEIGSLVNSYDAYHCVPDGTYTTLPEQKINGAVVSGIVAGCSGGKYVGDSGWIGNVRAGWSTKDYRLYRKLHASGHAVWQHTSDPRTHDGGLEFVGVGVTFKGKKR